MILNRSRTIVVSAVHRAAPVAALDCVGLSHSHFWCVQEWTHPPALTISHAKVEMTLSTRRYIACSAHVANDVAGVNLLAN